MSNVETFTARLTFAGIGCRDEVVRGTCRALCIYALVPYTCPCVESRWWMWTMNPCKTLGLCSLFRPKITAVRPNKCEFNCSCVWNAIEETQIRLHRRYCDAPVCRGDVCSDWRGVYTVRCSRYSDDTDIAAGHADQSARSDPVTSRTTGHHWWSRCRRYIALNSPYLCLSVLPAGAFTASAKEGKYRGPIFCPAFVCLSV